LREARVWRWENGFAALRDARSRQPVNGPEIKLKSIRRVVEYSFPTADMEQMLHEIERGYQD
jgi:hypothetical protein